MKRHIRSSFVRTSLYIADNKATFLFITLFTLGMVLGSFALYFAGNHSDIIVNSISSFLKENGELSFLSLLSRNMVGNFLYLGFFYVGGLCAIGLPFVALIPMIKGISLGTLVSYEYIFYGIKGFLYALVLIFLTEAILLTMYCFAYSEAIYMSLTVSNGIFASKPKELKHSLSFMSFTKRIVLIAVGVVLVSLAQALLTHFFSALLM